MEVLKQIGGLIETTAGPIDNLGKNHFESYFYSNDMETFRNEKGEAVEEKTLVSWATWLNNERLSGMQKRKYLITSPKEKNMLCDDPWCCIYKSEWLSGVIAVIIGYGKTEEEAFDNCRANFDAIQKKYNPNNISL